MSVNEVRIPCRSLEMPDYAKIYADNIIDKYDDFDVNKTDEKVKQWLDAGLTEEDLDFHISWIVWGRLYRAGYLK